MIPLAITGIGTVSALGVGYEAFTARLADPSFDPFDGPVTTFDASRYPGLKVAEARGFDAARILGDKGLRNNDRLTKLFIVATRLSLEDAGLKARNAWTALSADSVGICAATSYGSLEAITEIDRVARLEDRRYINPARFPNTVINSALGYVSIWEELRALNVTVTNGSTGALDAVFCASAYLFSGRARAVAVGGGEAMAEALTLAFARLDALATDGRWSPGHPESKGMRLGEGAALAVLEPLTLAHKRGARVRAVITGFGTAFEPPAREALILHTDPTPLRRAIAMALDDAGITAADVDVIASGLNGYAPIDAAELAAYEGFSPEVCVATPKGRFGECLGASGALAIASATAWIEGAPIHDTLRGKAPTRVRTVLVPMLGFYGNASAVIVRAQEQ